MCITHEWKHDTSDCRTCVKCGFTEENTKGTRTYFTNYLGVRKQTKNPFKSGDKVILKSDGRKYTVYTVYDDEYVSLGLYEYPDTEQDYLTHISEVKKVNG